MEAKMKQRLFTGVLAAAIIVVIIAFSHLSWIHPLFVIGIGALVYFSANEYLDLAQAKGFTPSKTVVIGMALLYVLGEDLAIRSLHLTWIPFAILLLALLLVFISHFDGSAGAIANTATGMFALAYTALPLTYALKINYFISNGVHHDGRIWLVYVLVVSKMTDVGAYFVGKSYGRVKLAPHISPQKTLEGSIGGTVAAVAASLCAYFILKSTPYAFSLSQSLWIGLLLSILSQLGDLSESLLKRDAGIKDSSNIPGLGGFLDMTDSVIFTLPCMYLLLQQKWIGY